jgi:hypothetical protein
MRKLLFFSFILVGILLFLQLVSANDLSPHAGTKLVLDNIKDFPDYTFFISSAGEECTNININYTDAEVRPKTHEYCNLKLFDKSGGLINFFTYSNGVQGQCFSPVYAIKISDFDENEFRNMNPCKQIDFLNNNTKEITSYRVASSRTNSYFTYLIEEHFNISLNQVQEEPSYLVEKRSYHIFFWPALIIISLAALVIILIIIFKKRK